MVRFLIWLGFCVTAETDISRTQQSLTYGPGSNLLNNNSFILTGNVVSSKHCTARNRSQLPESRSTHRFLRRDLTITIHTRNGHASQWILIFKINIVYKSRWLEIINRRYLFGSPSGKKFSLFYQDEQKSFSGDIQEKKVVNVTERAQAIRTND